jgi:hypothetical protein
MKKRSQLLLLLFPLFLLRQIPGAEAATEEMFTFMKNANIFNYFSDDGIRYFEPFFYQAMTQPGYYGYRPSLYRGQIRHVKDTTFRFAAPQHMLLKYDDKIMHEVDRFLQEKGDRFIFIYGGTDTWSATAGPRLCRSSGRAGRTVPASAICLAHSARR